MHINRDIEEHRAGPAFRCNGDRPVGQDGGHPVLDAKRGLGDGLHQFDMIEHLVGVAVPFICGNAACQHDHRHTVLMGVGDDVHRIGDARADGGDQDRRGPVMVMDALAHETGAILMLGEHDPDAGPLERVHDGEHFAARNAEGVPATGLGEPPGNQVR